jgi:hypothetical protein
VKTEAILLVDPNRLVHLASSRKAFR